MSPQDNNPSRGPDESQQLDSLHAVGMLGAEADSAMFAHELANLLDGSLRNVSLAMHSLADAQPPDALESSDDDVLKKLHAANGAMQQMARLIASWMGPQQTAAHHQDDAGRADATNRDVEAYHWPGTLGEAIENLARLIEPQTKPLQIEVITDITGDVATLPCGPIPAVLINTLGNSIHAIAAAANDADAPNSHHRIEIKATLTDRQVTITQMDTGIGLDTLVLFEQGRLQYGRTTKADGHGLGLMLSRDILHSLGGELQLTNRLPRGAIVTLRYPAAVTALHAPKT
jgi:signal transduction histidine kinase